jgi:hypothetical protein
MIATNTLVHRLVIVAMDWLTNPFAIDVCAQFQGSQIATQIAKVEN